jgi:hypothetical protein
MFWLIGVASGVRHVIFTHTPLCMPEMPVTQGSSGSDLSSADQCLAESVE